MFTIRLKSLLIAFLVISISCATLQSISEAKTLNIERVILSEDPWPPYTLGNEGEEPTGGIAVDVIRELFKRLGVEVQLKLHPWKRSLNLVKTGKEDGHMLLIKTPEWEEYLAFSDPFIPDSYQFWYRADREQPVEWENFEDLKKYKIGLTMEYSYGDELMEAVKKYNLEVDWVKSDELNFRKLLAGRFDTFVCMKNVANALFRDHPELKGKFKTAEKPLSVVDMYLALSKESPAVELMPEINKLIQDMKDDGTMEKLLNK